MITRALVKLMKGIMGMPLPWRLWVILLLIINLVVPILLYYLWTRPLDVNSRHVVHWIP